MGRGEVAGGNSATDTNVRNIREAGKGKEGIEMIDQNRIDVFISYSSHDREKARKIASESKAQGRRR